MHPSASVSFRRLPWTKGNHLHKYRVGADNNVCGRGSGSQSPWANIYLKLAFSAPTTQILSFRPLQSASGGIRWLPWAKRTHLHIYIVGGRQQCIWDGGWEPKPSGRYLPKSRVPSAPHIPILASVSFRRLPWTSADKGGPSPRILLGRRQQCMREGGRNPKFPGRYLPKIRGPVASYPDFSFRQLLSASVGFRGLPWAMGNHLHIYCRDADNKVCGRGAGCQSS